MKGSLQILRVAEIPIKIHWTFGLLLIWIGYLSFREGLGISGALASTLLIALVFLCVVLHEYGHALTARRFGVKTRDIILSPIGGIARLEKIPEKPRQEFLIAIAGPLVNLVIAALLILAILVFNGSVPDIFTSEFWSFQEPQPLMWIILKVNLILIAFNAIPAFPMDGGRVARALLSSKLGRTKATKIASIMGRVLAAGMFIVGIIWADLILSVIGVFIFLAALNEYKGVLFEQSVNRYNLREVLRPVFTRLRTTDLIFHAAQLSIQTGEDSFLVFDDDEGIAGVLHKLHLHEAIKQGDQYSQLSKYLSAHWEPVDPEMKLIALFQKFQSGDYIILPVIDETGRILGVVDRHTLQNIFEMGMQSANEDQPVVPDTSESI